MTTAPGSDLNLSFKTAAREAAPDNSAATPNSNHSHCAAVRIWSSLTNTMSSTYFSIIARLISALRRGARVLASLSMASSVTNAPASRLVDRVGGDDEIVVRRAERSARFVVPWERPFDQVVREKFGLDND